MSGVNALKNAAKEQIEIRLSYHGPDVDDGSMSVEDIVPVLQGFSSAYSKLASTDDPESRHNIRITGVKPGSADIVLVAWKFLGDNVDAITSAGVVAGGGWFIVKKILAVIALKKHVKRKPFSERINAQNSVVVSNSENVTIEVPLEIYELFKSGSLDPDMNKMMKPLQTEHIERVELSASSATGETIRETVIADERPYFDTTEVVTTSTRETSVVVKLNSLTKTTDSGWLYLGDGSRVFYQYTGVNPAKLHALFAYDGPVRVTCIAHMDESSRVVQLDISDLERTQLGLFDSLPPSASP
jgi:hypothetical protein